MRQNRAEPFIGVGSRQHPRTGGRDTGFSAFSNHLDGYRWQQGHIQMGIVDNLRFHSARWGKDAMLVQGAGGNTSEKRDGKFRVKASGLELADALDHDIFVHLPLGIQDPAPVPRTGLRPSIEAGLHAVLPHRFVAHLHMVDVLAYAVRGDGETALAPLLAGLDWRWLPYLKPGPRLAQAIAGIVRDSVPEIIVLGNHGIVIGGPDCSTVEMAINEVRRRLAVVPRSGRFDLGGIQEMATRLGLELPGDPATHQVALDDISLGVAAAGSLYPDHVVFLGRGIGVWPARNAMTILPRVGVLMAPGLGRQAHAMAACLAAVATRVAADAPVRPLSSAEEDELIDWEAETYRRNAASTTQREQV
jgi:rhamnose utilization protein RhaD (predicted bifunctional aldolase and dehydrogenase)